MGNIKGRFSDQDSYVVTQQALTAVNNNAEFNVALIENDYTRATSAQFVQQALTRSIANPVPDVTAAGQGTIGAALGGINQPPDASIPSPINPGCFAAYTNVELVGQNIPISLVRCGVDKVLAFDAHGRRFEKLIVGKYEHYVQESLIVQFEDGRWTHTTPEHLYWVDGDTYAPIGKLASVKHWDGEWQTVNILSKMEVRVPLLVYNLEVENLHTYFANGDAVHNLKPLPPADLFE